WRGCAGGSFGSFLRAGTSVSSTGPLPPAGAHVCLKGGGPSHPAVVSLRYVKPPSHICLRFAISKSLHGFPPLMRRQNCRSPEFHAAGLRSVSALSCAGDD